MLKLYFHPLSSFCQKALIAFHEADTPFERVRVDLGDKAAREAYRQVWPMLRFPVLVDETRGETVAESACVIDFLDKASGEGRLISADPDLARRARMWDRLFDDHLQLPMQRIVADAMRPAGNRDPYGVDESMRKLDAAYGFFEERVPEAGWMVGDTFGLAECSAAPALFWADVVRPIPPACPRLHAYFDHLKSRPSVRRTYEEAEPWFQYYPRDPKPRLWD